MPPKKKIEIIEKEIVKEVEKPIEEKRDFSIIERDTKQIKVIKKSEYNSDLHIAI